MLDIAERAPHVLDDFHLCECRLQRFGGGACCSHGRVTSCFCSFPQALPLLTEILKCRSVLIAEFPRLFCQSPQLFGGDPGILAGLTKRFSGRPVLLSVLPTVLRLLAPMLGSLASLP
jgi:hypothetical protein